MKKILLLFCVLLAFCACKTTRDIQITETDKITQHDTLIVRDTTTIRQIVRDSVRVFVNDSVAIDTATGVRHYYHVTTKYVERDSESEVTRSLREECQRLREEVKSMSERESVVEIVPKKNDHAAALILFGWCLGALTAYIVKKKFFM